MKRLLIAYMAITIWFVCPEIKCFCGRIWRRHFFESGEVL